MKVTMRRRLPSAGTEAAARTASASIVPPSAWSASMLRRARAFIAALAGSGRSKNRLAVLPKSITCKVSSGIMWSRIQSSVSLAFASGSPDCDPERSTTKISSLGATSRGATRAGGTKRKGREAFAAARAVGEPAAAQIVSGDLPAQHEVAVRELVASRESHERPRLAGAMLDFHLVQRRLEPEDREAGVHPHLHADFV